MESTQRTSRSSFIGRLLGLAVPTGPVGDEALLGARLRLYVGAIGAFASGFAVHDYVRNVMARGPAALGSPMLAVLAATGLGSGAAWLWLRRARPTGAVADQVELLASTTLLGAIGVMHLLAAPEERTIGLVPGLALVLVMRAAIVPSRTRRTFALGLAATAFHAWAAWRSGPRHGYEAAGWAWIVTIWGTAFTLSSALVSRVIYRLREEVALARRLGDYTLEEKIGEGAMGVVYRARHRFLKRPAALKLLPPDRAGATAIARFEREVQDTARLAHPNAVAVFDYGRTPGGVFYYVMELIDGLDLQTLVALDGPQPPGRVIAILAQVAHVLDAAHRRGLVHRDVKPANVMLCGAAYPDLAKVVDFGLVKELHDPGALALSRSEVVVGTPLYMPPEALIHPESVGPRSDLYALGAVGWFLLVGQPPFDGDSVIRICAAHLHEAPRRPSEALGAPLPRDLEDVLLACLAKEPEDRPPSGLALRRALLGCADATHWDLDAAQAWWDRHADEVEALRAASAARLQGHDHGHELESLAVARAVSGAPAARARG